MEVYASPMDFEARGEGGAPNFIPMIGNEKSATSSSLAGWFEIPKKPFYIEPEQTASIPFSLHVPKDAEPGGHYGAVLIGNQPNTDAVSGNALHVASVISSLFLVRVSGEIIEKGDIREFSTDKSMYQEPKATLSIRFENKGNVHIQPQGEITIYNMWGKERGKIRVNDGANFGNVLPKSIRKFSFEWTGESSFFDIGRYQAIAVLSFGDKVRYNVSSVISFWIVPVVPILKILAFFTVFIWFLIFSVKRYVKRAIAFEEERIAGLYGRQENAFDRKEEARHSSPQSTSMGERVEKKPTASSRPISAPRPSAVVLAGPFVQGVVDLRSAVSAKAVSPSGQSKTSPKKQLTLGQFVSRYKIFFISLVVLCAGMYAVKMYFSDVLTSARDYQVEIKREDGRSAPVSNDSQLRKEDIILPK
jgi:hypothetical protein